jgi:hypothetical protein
MKIHVADFESKYHVMKVFELPPALAGGQGGYKVFGFSQKIRLKPIKICPSHH